MAIALPTERSKPTTTLTDKVTLIYGAPKIGKSTFCAGAEKALFLATEPGLSHLEVYQTPVGNWNDFLEACSLIHAGEHDYKTIVIDTVDNLFKFCREYVLKKHNMQHEQDQDWGKGYDLVNTEFFRRLNALSLLPYGLILVSHAQDKEVKTRTGKTKKIVPTLPSGALRIVTGMADFILYADMEEVLSDDQTQITEFRRVLRTKPSTLYEAGGRYAAGQSALPDTLPLDWAAFAEALQATAAEPQATQQ